MAKKPATLDRRNFLRRTVAWTGGALTASGAARAAPLEVPASNQEIGRPIEPAAYGMPSKYEAHVARRRTDVFKNRQNWSDWSMTPLQHQPGIITPNGLIFERHHAGTPDIDPKTHRVALHGMVKQSLVFSMDDLVRYPSVSRLHFHECSGNGLTDWLKPASATVQQTHGLLSGVLWTGVPASTLLEEAGIDPRGKWVLFEGADASAHTRSIPIEKVLDDTIIAYAMNGEALRPENGYPVRVVIPGWEGNVSVKWLRRIKVGDQPWHFRSETARYTDPMPEGKWRKFSMMMECKSVITSPSGGQNLRGPGFYEVRGLAWSGAGKIRAVDVSFDGGRNWRETMLEEPILDKSLTRFKIGWNWDGAPALLMSRAVDGTGYVQPSVQDIQKARAIAGFVQHHPLGASGPHPVQPLPDKPRFGQLISEADLAAWNIDVRTSDGQGLPAGRGSVAEGRKIYEAKCASCHGAEAKGGPVYGTMVGGVGSFTTNTRVLTPGSMYPYAPILFDYIRRAMPMDRPQTLTANEVYAVSAYLLNLNGLVPADAVMDAASLPRVKMPNRDGFILDDRPDTKAVRCMTNCK